MTSASGKLIVFEGCDNVGKSTIVEQVVERLKKVNNGVSLLSFPGKTENTLGKLVYDFHHSEAANATDQTSLQLMHIAAHIDCINGQIVPLLNNGQLVILDRYWWSTFVYGLVGGVDLNHLKIMIGLEKEVWGVRVPDCVFLIRRREAESQPEVTGIAVEYERLAAQEQHAYPVKHIHNEETIEQSVQEIMALIGKP